MLQTPEKSPTAQKNAMEVESAQSSALLNEIVTPSSASRKKSRSSIGSIEHATCIERALCVLESGCAKLNPHQKKTITTTRTSLTQRNTSSEASPRVYLYYGNYDSRFGNDGRNSQDRTWMEMRQREKSGLVESQQCKNNVFKQFSID